MKNAFLFFFVLLLPPASFSQGKEDLTADAGTALNANNARNLSLMIGSDQVFRTNDSEKEKFKAVSKIKYEGLQYLYLQNQTVFVAPVSRKLPLEVISQSSNKLVFRVPQIRQNVLEVDLNAVNQSASQVGAQVATISFQ